MKLEVRELAEIIPYKNNPRRNEFAVEAVMESIRQCEYITPIVIDEGNEILAGHTRYMALQRLGYTTVECIVVDGLSNEQKRKFRILDNKVGEEAEWDFEKLKEQLENLELGDFKWFSDLANPNITEQIEQSRNDNTKDEDDGIVRCPRCKHVLFDPNEEGTVEWN